MDEDRVQHSARSGVQAEGDVGNTQSGVDSRVFRIDLADCLDGLDSVAAGFFLPGGNRESQGVHDDVVNAHSPLVDQGVH